MGVVQSMCSSEKEQDGQLDFKFKLCKTSHQEETDPDVIAAIKDGRLRI